MLGDIMAGTYLTPTVELAAQIMTNPWTVIIGVTIIGAFMVVFLFMMLPEMLRNPSKR
jgi:hypothetical protein